mmetsp:Transcript_12715/g.51090  ORF Transcript_12715/g.51090 Transcript_12715/m.51090 type:complete len:232 (+) Transcript_12715:287-982(+)
MPCAAPGYTLICEAFPLASHRWCMNSESSKSASSVPITKSAGGKPDRSAYRGEMAGSLSASALSYGKSGPKYCSRNHRRSSADSTRRLPPHRRKNGSSDRSYHPYTKTTAAKIDGFESCGSIDAARLPPADSPTSSNGISSVMRILWRPSAVASQFAAVAQSSRAAGERCSGARRYSTVTIESPQFCAWRCRRASFWPRAVPKTKPPPWTWSKAPLMGVPGSGKKIRASTG